MGEEVSQGITRRDLLRRGAVLGGAVVWTTPVVQTLGMGRAFAQAASPVQEPCTPEVSFIAMCVTCDGEDYLIKWENEGDGKWDTRDPVCGLDCGPESTAVLGSDLKFTVTEKSDGSGCFIVSWPSTSDCTVNKVTVFGGTICDSLSGTFSNGFEVCCPRRT